MLNLIDKSDNDELVENHVHITSLTKPDTNPNEVGIPASRNQFYNLIRGEKKLADLFTITYQFLNDLNLCDQCTFYMPTNNVLRPFIWFNVSPAPNATYGTGQGLIGRVAQQRNSVVVPSAEFETESNSENKNCKYISSIVLDNRTVAVVELAKAGSYTQDQMELLRDVADSLAVSINSANGRRDLEKVISKLKSKEHELQNRISAINKSNASIEFDLKGNILSVNELFLKLLGYSEEEVLGKHHSMFLEAGSADQPEYRQFWRNLSKGQFQQDEFKRIRKDGQSVWLHGNYNPIFDEQGNPERILKIATDITLNKRQQIEIDAITTAISKSNLTIEFDLDGKITKANDSFLEIVGYNLEDVVGKHHSIFISEDERNSAEYREFWTNLKAGQYQSGEYRRLTKTGETAWFKGNYNPIFDTQGNVYKVIKIASDITKAKNQQIEIDAITMAIYKSSLAIEFNMQGYILNANSIFQNIMGYSAKEIVGKHHSILVDPSERDSVDYREFWQKLQEGEFQEGEFVRRTKRGETVWIKGNYNPIFDTQGRPYKVLKIATDVSLARMQAAELERQATELQIQKEKLSVVNAELEQYAQHLELQHLKLQAAHEELERQTKALETRNKEVQAAKLLVEQKTMQLEISSKYKSEFLANMSHELRTPLNSLLILSQDLMFNKHGNLSEDQVESASVIYKSGNDLLALINEVLDLSKIEAGKMTLNVKKVALSELAKNIYLDFRHQAERQNLSFKIEMTDGLPDYIYTDPQRIEQVLRNIVSNAIKFTHAGEVTVRFAPHGSHIAISITDTGIGIPVSQHAAVFEAFQQADGGTSRKYGGTGLGLSISRDLVKLLEGEISLKSESHKGSVFTILLPRTIKNRPHGHAEIEQYKPADAKRSSIADDLLITGVQPDASPAEPILKSDPINIEILQNKTILLVDDDMRNVFALSKILRDRGMKILKADTGQVALDLLKKFPYTDLVLMDIMMPEMDGYEAMSRIRAQFRFANLPIIALTAKAMEDDHQKCLDAGANGYMSKPIEVDSLLTRMCQLLQPQKISSDD
ncbi:MAG: PAS domain S-box protein [Flavobacterium sp.]|nr:PAS domain S-box protein [Flavobacterium sp.]